MIPYSRQQIDEDDIGAVVSVLRSDYITQGPAIAKFEQVIAAYCGTRHAVAVSSCTAGLHLACLALGVGPGDTVWTSPISFVASANCARYCGAGVGFVDIDPDTGNLSLQALEVKLAWAAAANALPKALVVVHFAGRVCDMGTIAALCRRHNVRIIEDAAHALGAIYQGRPVGACSFSDVVVFSFHPVKSVTTGEGGALTTNDPALAETLVMLRTHGITRKPELLEAKDPPGWHYEMQQLGYHYRMTDIQAALGISQMHKLDRFVAQRRLLAERYHTMLQGLPLLLPPADPESAWHLYAVRLTEEARIGRRALYDGLRRAGIGVNVHYIPIHLQPYYRRLGFKPGDFPQAERFYERALSIPLYPGLTEEMQDVVIQSLSSLITA